MTDIDKTRLNSNLKSETEGLTRSIVLDQSQSAQVDPAMVEQFVAPLSVGDTLKNRFEIVELLGEGGMGRVFKAIDARKVEAKSRNPFVAIKVLNPALSTNPVLIAGLQRECEKAQELSHPNIITVFDFDRDGDYVYMSMEYLAGRSLAQLIREASISGGMPLKDAWPIIRSMGEALVYAHKMGIIHSDFKPANVFITDQQQVKVLDFGIASRLDQNVNDETVFDARTEGGLTLPYASFEMLNGSRADPRDDIYAFGLVVYELLTGNHPYGRKPASTVFLEQRRGKLAELKTVSGLNRRQWQLLKSAINILQEQRPANLDNWLNQFNPHTQSRILSWILSGLSLVVLTIGGVVYWQLASRPINDSLQSLAADNASRLTTKQDDLIITQPLALPMANAGDNERLVVVGKSVRLDATASQALTGGPLSYRWQIIEKPANSNATLSNSDSVASELTPDQTGNYRVELEVIDAKNLHSVPVRVLIKANPDDADRVNLSANISQDGVLSLASSKDNYMIGEVLILNFRVKQAGYLRVAYLSNRGEVSEIFPNQYQSDQVKPGIEYHIPPKNGTFKMQITGPSGFDKIVAVFSQLPIAKVKHIVNTAGALNPELQDLAASSASIQFQVMDK